MRLNPPVDLHARELNEAGDYTKITHRATTQTSAILHALTAMDGIVLFSSDAHIHGFRCFIKPRDGGPGTGGARRLAYEALGANKEKFRLALMRSQDGATHYERWDGVR